MPLPDIESKALKEKLLPQTSLRFLFALITASAFVIVLLQASASSTAFWTKILTLVLATGVVSFGLYALMFLIAGVISKTAQPIIDALENPEAGSSLDNDGLPVGADQASHSVNPSASSELGSQ